MKTTISRLYDRYEDAAAAVNALVDAGIADEDLSLIVSTVDDRQVPRDIHVEESDASSGAGTGAGIGGVVGGGAGILAGLGMLAIPGVGPVVAAGWLAATAAGALAGAAAGAATGGIIGALTDSGVSESEAHVYAEGIRRGGSLVTARVENERVGEAVAILDRHRPVDADARAAAYRNDGWDGFDSSSKPYTREQVDRERRLYEAGPRV